MSIQAFLQEVEISDGPLQRIGNIYKGGSAAAMLPSARLL